MKTILRIVVLLLLVFESKSQTFEKTFSGEWARTQWVFNFYKDGTYKRVSKGHYGSTEVNGKYRMFRDTIQLLSGFANTAKTLNEFYLLKMDKCIVDMTLFYDYCVSNESYHHNSIKRYDILIKPNPDSIINMDRQNFDSLVIGLTKLLKTKDIRQFSKEDHIRIVRVFNTIWKSYDADHKRFVGDVYHDFRAIILKSTYGQVLQSIYSWIPSQGDGHHFIELQVDLGGTPNAFSCYVIQ